jgi:hypothetical protein
VNAPARKRGVTRSVVRDRLFAIALATASLALAFGPLTPGTGAQTLPELELSSSWNDSLNTQLEDGWEPAMRTATATPVAVDNTIAIGDSFARQSLYKGLRDFVVTGGPLPAEEVAALPAGSDYISLPISTASLVVVMRQPAFIGGNAVGGWFTETKGPVDEEGNFDLVLADYTGPLRMQASLLLDMVQIGVEALRDRRFVRDNSVDLASGGATTWLVARSDPGSLNVALQNYFAVMEPARWAAMVRQYNLEPGYAGEMFAVSEASSRSLDGSMMATLSALRTPRDGTASAGTVGITTLARLKSAQERFPAAGFRAVTIKNAAGNWVTPTQQSVAAGISGGLKVDTSGTVSFTDYAALVNASLQDAYPLTWLNYLHAPAKGLSIEKTNALASFIRYAVTDGQQAHDVAGDPRLPAPLVQVALRQADALVESNCSGSGRVVTTRSDAGPHAPGGKLTGVAQVKWCAAAPPPTTTTAPSTTTVATTTTLAPAPVANAVPVVAAPPVAAGPVVTAPRATVATTTTPTTTIAPTTTTAPPTTTIATQVAGATQQRTAADAVLIDLPYGEPNNEAPPFNRLTTMAVGGGGLYAAIRRWFRRSAS